MADYPRYYGQGWTPAQVERLKGLAQQGLNSTAIARRMGRTRAGIVKKAVTEGLSLYPAKRDAAE